MKDPQRKDKDKKKEISKLHQAQPTNGILLMDGSRIPDYKQTADDFEEQFEETNKIVQAVYEASKEALQTKRKDAKVQTDQACMNNAQMYEYWSEGKSEQLTIEEELTAEKTETMEKKYNQLQKKLGINMDEATESDLDENEDPGDLPTVNPSRRQTAKSTLHSLHTVGETPEEGSESGRGDHSRILHAH